MNRDKLTKPDLETIAIFGGSFDPIHNGHLNSALELCERLSLNELRLLPCHRPNHKQILGCNSEQRLAMVQLAIKNCGDDSGVLQVDDREIKHPGISYSIETLEQLRVELGESVSIIWVMGTDSLASLNSWHRWEDFLSLAHIVVMTRPGSTLPVSGPVAHLIESSTAATSQQLKNSSCGLIWFESLSPYPISATAIRTNLIELSNRNAKAQPDSDELQQKRKTLEEMMPKSVLDYIEKNRLYG